MNDRQKYTCASCTYEVTLRSGGVERIEANTVEIEGGHAVFSNWDGLVKVLNAYSWSSIERMKGKGE